ncbi:outer membrane lipoprotein carrier protein LolA [Streptomyces jumonjinensis]|uniref:outer membrane lipoprotein carrier protein LolA n=1 Tax=Streptomyces jumonjinensis TaxID=1945 RepID=UPI0037A5CE15
MASHESAQNTDESQDLSPARRRAARYFVPVAVAGIAAATIGLVPALAASGDPDLPEISAQELIEKIAASETEQLSGTVKISTDLGLPSIAALADNYLPGPGEGGREGSSAAPEDKLTQLATGTHTLRVAFDGPERQKISVLEESAEYSMIHNEGEIWAYDSASNEAMHTEKPGGKSGDGAAAKRAKPLSITPQEFAEQALKAAGPSTSVTVDGTAQVAGRDAYQLAVKPRQSGSTIGSIKIAVDSETGTPLKFSVNPSSGGKAAIDVGFTKVDFSKPSSALFEFTPPKGTKVTEADESAKGEGEPSKQDLKELEKELENEFGGFPGGGLNVIGKDWTSIAKFGTGAGEGGSEKGAAGAEGDGAAAGAMGILGGLGDPVSGDFGSGTVFETRLINALMTDDGQVYVGAVTKDALVKAANADK